MIREELSEFTFSEEKHKNVFYAKNEVDFLLNSFEQQNTALQARIKDLEEPKTCDGCVYWKLGGGCSGNFMIKCNRLPHLVDRFKPKQN